MNKQEKYCKKDTKIWFTIKKDLTKFQIVY